MMVRLIALMVAFAPSAAFAAFDVEAKAPKKISIYSSPGMSEIKGEIPAGAAFPVTVCIRQGEWCIISFEGVEGFVKGAEASATVNGSETTLTQAYAAYWSSLATPAKAESKSQGVRTIYAFGDSLTHGAGLGPGGDYPAQLSRLVGKKVVNLGAGEQKSFQIAARAGGAPVKMSVTGGMIEPYGSALIKSRELEFLTGKGPQEVEGTLAGQPGRLSRMPSGQYIFNRTSGGESVECDECEFIATPMQDKASSAAIIWVGTNNHDADRINADVDAMIKALGNERYIVVGVLNRDHPTEIKGGPKFEVVERINAGLAERYGEHFIDMRQALLEAATSADRDDVENLVTPASLRYDEVHPNQKGAAVVAKALAAKIKQMGW